MFTKNNTREFRTLREAIEMRPLAFEQKTILCEFKLGKGYCLPSHNHTYEQTGYLLTGKLNFRMDKKWHLVESGDSWSIHENVEHEVGILEDSVVLELFSPIHPDYLP